MTSHNLPVQTTSFIGRDEELKDILALFQDPHCRLVTLVGPGGVGKTRLALEAAWRSGDRYKDGAFLIELDRLKTREHVLHAISKVMDFAIPSRGDLLQQVLQQLSHRQALLIFDNYESLIDEAPLAAEILQAAGGIRLLATSREPLNLQEEWLRRIDGLPCPPVEPQDLREIAQCGALQLFLERARQAGAALDDPAGLACAARVCRLVNGVPLAIELAATLLRTMTCGEIAAQLQQNLDILSTPIRNIPDRHRSIRAVFEESWLRLNEQEQQGFLNLSLFAGSFKGESAAGACGMPAQVLRSLVDKSLLQRGTDGRYRFHELLTQFASEKLGENPAKEDEAVRLFCNYYGNYLENRDADIKGQRQMEALDEIEQEFAHLRAAWQHAVLRRDFETIGKMVPGLNHFCFIRGFLHEYRTMTRQAIEQLRPQTGEPPHAVWGSLLARQDFSSLRLDEAASDAQTSLQIARREDNPADTARSLFALGRIANGKGDQDAALGYFRQSLQKYQQLGDPFYIAFMLSILGKHFLERGEFETASQHLEQSLEINRQSGNREGEAYCLDNLAAAQFNRGAFSDARRYHLLANSIYTVLKHRPAMAYTHVKSGSLAMFFGDYVEARRHFSKGQALAEEIKYAGLSAFARANLAALESLEHEDYALCMQMLGENPLSGEDEELLFISGWGGSLAGWGLRDFHAVQQNLKASLSMAVKSKNLPLLLFCLPMAAALLEHQGEAVAAVELLATSFEHPLSLKGWKEQTPLVADLISTLKRSLPPVGFERAWQNGKKRELSEVISFCTALTAAQNGGASKLKIQTQPARQQEELGSAADALSERELEVLRLLAKGYSNRQIASQLVIALGTTKAHIHNIYSKLDAESRTQAVHRARQLSLLD